MTCELEMNGKWKQIMLEINSVFLLFKEPSATGFRLVSNVPCSRTWKTINAVKRLLCKFLSHIEEIMWFSVNTAQLLLNGEWLTKFFTSWCIETLFWFGFIVALSLYYLYRLSFHFSYSEEKPVGFRLKPPTLIHGQAPSSGQCQQSFCERV